jgi:hypothetical protein
MFEKNPTKKTSKYAAEGCGFQQGLGDIVREAKVWPEPVADLELVDHGGHAHLVLLREAVQVSEHALVHGVCRRRRRRKEDRALERTVKETRSKPSDLLLLFLFNLMYTSTRPARLGRAYIGFTFQAHYPSSSRFGSGPSRVDLGVDNAGKHLSRNQVFREKFVRIPVSFM